MLEPRGKRLLVLGLAREGVTLARYLQARGAQVTAADRAQPETLRAALETLQALGVEAVIGGDHPELVNEADALFVSPGVPEDNPTYRAAVQRGLPIESMTTLFFDICPGRIVGITGSSGKTTTTGLIGHMARGGGLDVVVGGNIGDPMLDLLPEIGPGTTVVLELSSFQLALLRCSPQVAVVTNITPNHLDRHRTMDEYVAAKRQIVAHQSADDCAVLNHCDPWRETFAAATPARLRWFGERAPLGARLAAGSVSLLTEDGEYPVLPAADIPLLGRHNVENVLAAVAAAHEIGVPLPAMAAAVRSFRPAAHRLETVGTVHGVTYIDDSIATTPARAQVALEALASPIVLIAGGRDKHLPWEEFARAVVKRVRLLLLIGEAAGQIEAAVRQALQEAPGVLQSGSIHRCGSLREAVHRARREAVAGESVLLAPACTSYDMFTNFEERGRVFARAVGELDAA